MISILFRKKNLQQNKGIPTTVNKIIIFIQICLTSYLYRSMWTIGQSQRVEEKNIDLSFVKYGIYSMIMVSNDNNICITHFFFINKKIIEEKQTSRNMQIVMIVPSMWLHFF